MTKKHRVRPFPKPANSSLSYFASASSPGHGTSAPETTPTSVNGLLAHLRVSQTHHIPDQEARRAPTLVGPSVPPPLQAILGAEPPPPPRPRIRIGAPRRGRAPGPPPPASWFEKPAVEVEDVDDQASSQHINDVNRLPELPDISGTPLTQALLISMAKNWDFHKVYDQHYLHELRGGLKALLLAHVAAYSPAGVGADGLWALFSYPDDSVTSADEITHLDLSRAGVGFRTLTELFSPPAQSELEEASWEATMESGSSSVTRFGSLTHLSLAYLTAPSWTKLLAFVKYTPKITHLSLAGWPPPPEGLAKRLSRRLLCLKWLDVNDCAATVYEALKEAEWTSTWRTVANIKALQVGGPAARVAAAVALEEHVRNARRSQSTGEWLEVECGDREVID